MLRFTSITILIALFSLGAAIAQTTVAPPATADEMLRHATYLASVGDYQRARDTFYSVCEQFPGTTAVDKAVVGIAKTYLGEEDYRRSIMYLEDVLVKSANMEARTEARNLYTTLEKHFRTARTRAETFFTEKKAEYEMNNETTQRDAYERMMQDLDDNGDEAEPSTPDSVAFAQPIIIDD